MGKHIKYFGYFDFQDSTILREYAVSATNKMEYIADAIVETGKDVMYISVSPCIEKKFCLCPGKIIKKTNHISATFSPSFGGQLRILRIIRFLWHYIYLLLYLLFMVKKNETIIVYHSMGYRNVFLLAKRIIKFHMILEVEEIYQDVVCFSQKLCKTEYDMFDTADGYIFSTEALNEKINKLKKPSIIIYGTYKVEPQISAKFHDKKIHVVYAGTFDVRKGGAAAAAAAIYLPSNYHIHICGFGNEKDTLEIKQIIEEISHKSKATITFDGLKKGKEYIKFIQSCHIGLSTQDPNAPFNATSFPSKILSYMSNGLSVLSIDIPVIHSSAIGPYISYYKNQTAENISKAIMNTDTNNNNRNLIKNLSDKFIKELANIL